MGAEEAVEFVALRGGHLLRIGEVRMPETVGDNRGGGVNGTGPAAAPDFIDPGDDGRLARAQGALEGPGEGGGFKGHLLGFAPDATQFFHRFHRIISYLSQGTVLTISGDSRIKGSQGGGGKFGREI